MTMNNAMLGANAPIGASSDVAIHSVNAAATYTPRRASTSADPTGVTGTTAARKVWGALFNELPSATSVARVGTPSTAVLGSTMSAESQIPPTVTTASRTSACQ